jgi:hypothetical protein
MSDEERPGDGDGSEDRETERSDGERREPLGDLTEEIEERRKRREGADGFADAFEDVSVESADTDSVWEELSQEDAEPTAEPVVEPESGDSAVDADLGDRDVRVIDKRSFCQGCRYFSAPPSVACSHEGTDILELVDAGHFRVADCPMVVEAEQLTDELGSDDS